MSCAATMVKLVINGASRSEERMVELPPASSRRPLKWLALIALATTFIVAGCATPIGVRYVEPHVAYHSLTANVLSAERPSSFTSRAG